MALQVWLPLNGNLDNQGLSNITVINHGATVNDNGKIGKCYSFDGSSQFLQFSDSLGDIYSGDFSWALWIKPIDDTRGVLISEYSSSGASNVALELHTNRRLRIWWSGSPDYYPNYSLPKDVWTHLTVTKTTNLIKVYINGELLEEKSATLSNRPSTSKIRIGDDYRGGTSVSYMGYLNDVRIYDHCLSPKEIREISKALILHYKLNDTQVLNNCFNYPTFNTSSLNGGWGHWAPSGSSGSYSQNTNKEFIYNKSNTYSHFISCTSGNYYLMHQSPDYDGGYRSAQAIIKMSDNSVPTSSKLDFGWNANVGTRPVTEFIPLIDDFYLMRCNGFQQSGSNDLVGIDIFNGNSVYISEIYLENNREFCSELLNTNTIYDCSGYQNSGTLVADLTLVSDSPRYDKSAKNSDLYPLKVTSKPLNISEVSSITISCWINLSELGYQVSGIWSTSNSSLDPEDYSNTTCNHRDSGFDLKGINGTGYRLKFDTSDITLNTWNHISVTHDGSVAKLYKNGSLLRQIAVPTPLVGFKYFYLGYSKAGAVVRQCKGKWSDLRIYMTTLDENSIEELYNTSAFIDNQGNLDCFEINETDETQPNILKNGEVDSYNFMETHPYLYLPAGSSVDSGLYYNAGDTCKAETIIRYSGGSGRDLMGYSSSGGGYWGVTANGTWEPNGTFTYTNSDINVVNHISYTYYSTTVHGTYVIGKLANTYSVRNKYIYRVRLYRNGILERDLHPLVENSVYGLFDILNGVFYPSSGSGVTMGYEEEDNIARIYQNHIKSNQIIEI